MTPWFPQPAGEEDVILLAPSGTWTPTDAFALITDRGVAEWRHKVGVAGPHDGSARSTTRLLALGRWVCKTRVDETYSTFEEGRSRLLEARARGRRAGLWHPEKVWGLIRAGGAIHPLTICPRLVTLRTIERLEDRMAAWIAMIQVGIDVHRLYGLGLDVNPSNFGREPGASTIHYLDDDLYAELDERMLGGAIVSRIPEEPVVDHAAWQHWGTQLRGEISLGELRWERLVEEIRDYPLPERYEPARRALVTALAEQRRQRRAAGPSELTCLLADVHANLPALDAVLADARARGATDYVFLGDAVGYGPHPRECVQRLADLPRAVWIRGNHDDAIATGRLDVGMNSLARECAEYTRGALGSDELSWLDGLPPEHLADGWLAVHGAPKDPRRFLAYVYELTYEDNLRHLREQRIPVCFFGHTHVQMTHVELASGPSKLAGPRTFELNERSFWLVNPGSVGQPRDGDARAAYALWDRRSGVVTTLRVAYDLDRTIRALRAAALPARLEARLQAGA